MPTSLSGLRVLITRPEAQAQNIIQALNQYGARPWHFPLVEIAPLLTPPPTQLIELLSHYDLAIFISPNAVLCLANALGELNSLPDTLKLACIGRGSARELHRLFSRVADILPAENAAQDSEALLNHAQLTENTIQKQNILIIRGQGGREKLATELRQRKAKVDYLELYQRASSKSDPAPLNESIAQHKLDAIIITSCEALHNLMDLVTETNTNRLLQIPLLTIHPRQADAASKYGFAHIYPSMGAATENIISALRTIN